MTKVDFYVLEDNGPGALLRFACQLTEKVYSLGHQVHLHSANEQMARKLDQSLWTFSELAFIPHQRVDADHPLPAGEPAPVTIGMMTEKMDPVHCEDVLVNLGGEIPTWFSRFSRVAEIVAGDDEQRHQARERYRFYRDRGYNLDMHTIKPTPDPTPATEAPLS